jgi:hypothetical protein
MSSKTLTIQAMVLSNIAALEVRQVQHPQAKRKPLPYEGRASAALQKYLSSFVDMMKLGELGKLGRLGKLGEILAVQL